MSHQTRLASLLLASATGLMLAIPSATAQDYGYGPPPGYDAGPPPPEEGVIIVAPRFRYQPRPGVGVLPGTVSLSTRVSYSDLDLRTRGGARELRRRVRAAAADVCGQLGSAYGFQQLHLTNCLHDASDWGLRKADIQINNARIREREVRWFGYSD